MSEKTPVDTNNQATESTASQADNAEVQAAAAQGSAADTPEASPEPAEPSLEEQLAEARKAAADNHNHYLRAMADLDNYRKRAMREKDELRQYATSRLLEDLLPSIDNLGLGLTAARQPNADATVIAGGIEMAINSLKGVLANHGLTEINPAGADFDPHKHEAISHLPSADIPAEKIHTVVRSGYMLNNRLLRPATVVVSSGPAA